MDNLSIRKIKGGTYVRFFLIKTSSDNLFKTRFFLNSEYQKNTWFMKTSDFYFGIRYFFAKLFNLRKPSWSEFQFNNSAGDIFIEKYPVWDGNNFVLILNNFDFWHKNTKKF